MARSSVQRSGGLEAFLDALTKGDDIRREVNEAANAIRRYARQNIKNSARGGRIYPKREKNRRWVPGSRHQASAPGEAPAELTGTLASRIRTTLARKGTLRKVAFVRPQAPHAHLLEFGTVRMKPRPFFGPAVRQVTDQFQRGIKAAARRELDKAAKAAQRKMRKARQP